jgi:hypothetical protein
MIPTPNYVEIISRLYPDTIVTCSGDGSDYSSIEHQSGPPIPPQEELDAGRITVTRDIVWREIQRVRDARKAGGVKVGDNWFHSDDTSRIQQMGLVMFGENMPPGIMWKTMSGTFVVMTSALAQSIFTQIATSDTTIFAIAEQHRSAMLASPTPETYDFSGNWPPIFSEA